MVENQCHRANHRTEASRLSAVPAVLLTYGPIPVHTYADIELASELASDIQFRCHQ
jgi:hypothetical protein